MNFTQNERGLMLLQNVSLPHDIVKLGTGDINEIW